MTLISPTEVLVSETELVVPHGTVITAEALKEIGCVAAITVPDEREPGTLTPVEVSVSETAVFAAVELTFALYCTKYMPGQFRLKAEAPAVC